MASMFPYGGQQWQDPFQAANQRAQARVDSGTTALQQALAQRLQGYQESRDRMKDDAEWALRTGAQANMRALSGQNAIHSGLRDRYAQRLQAQVGRPLMRGLSDLRAQENLTRGDIAQQVAALQGSLPVMQAEELGRQYNLDAQALSQAIQQAAMTGRFLPPQAQSLIQGVIRSKQQWHELDAAGKKDEAAAVSAQATQMRNALQAMGIDASALGADVTLDQAAKNSATMGTLTPAQRQMLANMTGYDPATGQQTLAGQQTQQALDQGRITTDIMKNPDYGAAAEAQARMKLLQAQVAQAQSALSQPKAVTREALMGKWNIQDVGLTTNFGAFDQLLSEMAQEALDGNLTPESLESFISMQSRDIRANGIDPRAVWQAAQAFVNRAALPAAPSENIDPAWQALRQYEREFVPPASGYGVPQPPHPGLSQAQQVQGMQYVPSYYFPPTR